MLSVGINAAPLLAPRTGVGRYIAGLLSGLKSIAEAEAFAAFALFGPELEPADSKATAQHRATAFAIGGLRRLAKKAPGGYLAAELARAISLERARNIHHLDLFHETNHAAPRTRLPVVVTVHDLSTLLFPETQEQARARYFANALRTRTAQAARIVTPTEAIKSQLVQLLQIPAARVRAIHHGIDANLPARSASASRPPALLQADITDSYYLFVGALEPRKGLTTLIDAYDSLPDRLAKKIPLVLAGPPDRIDCALASRLARARSGRIVQLGYTRPEDLPGLYRHATALALPSIYEGFGLPLLEAMACGLACAITDDPALAEIAAGAAAVSPRGDAPALAQSLARLADDPSFRAGLSARGRLRAAGFSWEKSAREHLQVYQEAVRDP